MTGGPRYGRHRRSTLKASPLQPLPLHFPESMSTPAWQVCSEANRVTRLRRGVYVIEEANPEESSARGVKPVTVRSTLTTFGMVVQSFLNQGALTRNVIALVERPGDELVDGKPETSKSWTLAEIHQFRASLSEDRLFACWLLSCYGLRRSEVLGIRWSALKGDTLAIRRSLRDLPLPPELAAALQDLKTLQQNEARAFGHRSSDAVWSRCGRTVPDPPRVVLRRISALA
jgi:hypothetical protein